MRRSNEVGAIAHPPLLGLSTMASALCCAVSYVRRPHGPGSRAVLRPERAAATSAFCGVAACPARRRAVSEARGLRSPCAAWHISPGLSPSPGRPVRALRAAGPIHTGSDPSSLPTRPSPHDRDACFVVEEAGQPRLGDSGAAAHRESLPRAGGVGDDAPAGASRGPRRAIPQRFGGVSGRRAGRDPWQFAIRGIAARSVRRGGRSRFGLPVARDRGARSTATTPQRRGVAAAVNRLRGVL